VDDNGNTTGAGAGAETTTGAGSLFLGCVWCRTGKTYTGPGAPGAGGGDRLELGTAIMND